MADTPPPYPTTGVVECEVCAGLGRMTARAADADPHTPPAVIPCPACGGKGATLRPFPPPKLAVMPRA